MQDPKALFFVDHYQAEIFERYVAGNEPMRSDDNVDAAPAQVLQNSFLLRPGTKPTQHLDAYRIIEHSLPKSFEMLLCQHRGRRENRDLFSIHHRFKGGSDCNFSFAEANVTANQAVHRLWPFHVGFGIDNGG